MNISQRIKRRREDVGLTLKGVAVIVGVAESTILRWENGEIQKLDTNKVEALAKALKCSPAYIMGWEDVEVKYELIELYDQASNKEKEEIVSFARFKIEQKNLKSF